MLPCLPKPGAPAEEEIGGHPLRVALVILHNDPRRGGAEKYTLQTARALASRGHQVSLLATTHAQAVPGVHCVPIQVTAGTKTGKYLALLDSLDEHFEHHHYDIVHSMLPVRKCDLYHPHAGLAAATLAYGHQKYSNPAVRGISWLCNQSNIRRRAYAAIEAQLLKSPEAPGVLCLSEYVRASVREEYSLDRHKIHLLFNAVDLGHFDPERERGARVIGRRRLGLSPQQALGLMVAQDFARKGLAEAIDALAQLPRDSMKLAVIGRDDPEPYQRQARNAGLEKQVLFIGATSDVRRFYQAADCLVLPTRHDPCSLVVLEALAMGLPVISTRRNGACEIMEHGVHGFVLQNPEDTVKLAEAMRQMLDPGRRHTMSEACVNLRSQLDFNNHIEELLQIYRGVQQARMCRGRLALPWME